MNIIFTMAGNYSRFIPFANRVPKYLLPLANGSILKEVIHQTTTSCQDCDLYFIANNKDQLFFPVLSAILESFDIPSNRLVFIDDTSSQLETATELSNFEGSLLESSPVVFMNIDTVLFHRKSFFKRLGELSGQDAGLIDVFQGYSNTYSYCLTEGDKVKHVAEKKIISKIACSGLYGFGSLSFFRKYAEFSLSRDRKSNFTDLYNFIIESGHNVHYSLCENVADTIVLGTPQEYIKNIHRL